MTKGEKKLFEEIRETFSTSATVFPQATERAMLALIDRLARVEEAARELQDAADDLSCIVNVDAPDTIRYDKAREALRAELDPETGRRQA